MEEARVEGRDGALLIVDESSLLFGGSVLSAAFFSLAFFCSSIFFVSASFSSAFFFPSSFSSLFFSSAFFFSASFPSVLLSKVLLGATLGEEELRDGDKAGWPTRLVRGEGATNISSVNFF